MGSWAALLTSLRWGDVGVHPGWDPPAVTQQARGKQQCGAKPVTNILGPPKAPRFKNLPILMVDTSWSPHKQRVQKSFSDFLLSKGESEGKVLVALSKVSL